MSLSSKANGLAIRIVVAVVVGAAAGTVMMVTGALPGLSQAGLFIIRLLKMLAAPLLFFAVIDAFVRADIAPRLGGRLLFFAALNAVVAVGIGLGVAFVLRAGERWQGRTGDLLDRVGANVPKTPEAAHAPANIVEFFTSANLVWLVVLAAAIGLALRALRGQDDADAIGRAAHGGFLVAAKILSWLVELVPLAVAAILAGVVAKNGLKVFAMLGGFVATITIGMVLQVAVYYSLLLRTRGHSPWRFFSAASEPILTALSCGSSLATLPVTLRALGRMGVPEASARLSACVGTNLNHAGIILYEAAAALFVAQALGWPLDLPAALRIASASVLAGIGISGVPEAGLITLPLVLAAAGVDDAIVATLLPLLFSVDWFIGRLRAATNVTSDMVVAQLL